MGATKQMQLEELDHEAEEAERAWNRIYAMLEELDDDEPSEAEIEDWEIERQIEAWENREIEEDLELKEQEGGEE